MSDAKRTNWLTMCLSVSAGVLLLLTSTARAELVAWWDFDQAVVAGVTVDQRGGQAARLLGGAVLTPDGEGRTGLAGDVAARFGTGNQHLLNVGDYFTSAFTGNEGTVCFWIKHATIRNSTPISFVSSSPAGDRGFQAHAPWGDNNAYFDTGGSTGGAHRIAGPMVVNPGTWHHVALVRGSSTGVTNKWIYLDGGLVASGINDATIAMDFTKLFIGNGPSTIEAANADIDDVSVFSRELNLTEITSLAGGAAPDSLAIAPTDSDGDSLPDLWETYYFPGDLGQLQDSPADYDGDGLEDALELARGSNPTVPDSDGDGLLDGVETGTGTWLSASDTGTSPLVSDTDGDGLLDGVESNTGTYRTLIDTGTNPHLADTDSDLAGDSEEIDYDSDPTDGANRPTLLAWWRFDDDSNPAAATDSRAGIVANMVGPAVYTGDGGGATGLSGDKGVNTTGGGLNSALATWLNIGTRVDKLTVMFWQRNTTNPASSSFWMNSASLGRGMQAHVPWSNSILYYDHSGASGSSQRLQGTPAITWTDWHHFAFVKDGGQKYTYIDGSVFLNQASGAAAFATDFDNLAIGYNGSGNSVDGQIDEFAIFASGIAAPDILNVANGTNTAGELADTDGDGLVDTWELIYFPGDLTQLAASPADYDSDGSPDAEELARNTDPTDTDSDDDGLLDGQEDGSGSYASPTDPGTDPLARDTDNDGFPDAVEGPNGADPNDQNSVPYALGSIHLMACWNFDDATVPGQAVDSVLGRIGTVTGTYSAAGDGRSGSASDRAMCLAAGQTVTVDANFLGLASVENKITFSFWQKRTSTPESSSFWVESASAAGGRGFQAHVPWVDSTIYFDHSGCCTNGVTRISGPLPGTVDRSLWHHFALVKDGNDKRVYVDGNLTVSGGGTAPILSDFTTLFIGSGPAGSINGCIDEFAIFAGALSATQISLLAGGDTPDTILSPGTIYDDWTIAEGLTPGVDDGPTQNPDLDTLVNLLEFAFGTDPLVSDISLLGVHFVPPFSPANVTARFSMRKDAVAAGLTYVPEFSADLVIWESDPANPVPLFVSDLSADYEFVEVPYLIFLPDGQKARFFRIRVNLTPSAGQSP